MISKVFNGHNFYHACRYICSKQGAEVLEAEGVRGHNYKYMADDFATQAGLRPSKKQACFHAVLSFYPGEKPSDELMAEIGRKYLERIGITNTQFAIAKHTDRAHLHLHIVANMVDNNGQSIKDGWIGLNGKKIAQQLTREYGLVIAEKKSLAQTNLEALSQSEANRYQVYRAILECLPLCRSMDDLAERLKEKGIETIYKYKGQTDERQGVSFRYGEDCFKGSKVDRKFSLHNLEKIMAVQQQVAQKYAPQPEKISVVKTGPAEKIVEGATHILSNAAKTSLDTVGQLLTEMLKPEYAVDNTPYELLREIRKRKRKRPRL